MFIRYSNNKHSEISKFNNHISSSFRTQSKGHINSSHSRSDFLSKGRIKTQRKSHTKTTTFYINKNVNKLKNKNKLNEIFEEVTNENNALIKKPKLSLNDIIKIIKKNFRDKYTKYYTDTKIISYNSGNIKPTIYQYFQISNLFDKKKCRIKVAYDEFNIYFNNKETLFEYNNIKQSYDLLKFIIIFFHKKNVYNISSLLKEKNKYKINNFIRFIQIVNQKMNKIEEYKSSNLFGIFEQIKKINEDLNKNEIIVVKDEIYDFIKTNNIFEYDDVKEISEKLKEYEKYLSILLNIPLIYYSCIFPNYFRFGYKINLIIKIYVIKRLTEIKKNKQPEKETTIEKERTKETITFIKDKINSYSRLFNDSILKAKGKSFMNKENLEEILDNKPIWSYFKRAKDKQENRRQIFDQEIMDIQNFINNLKILKEKKRKVFVSFNKKENEKNLEENTKNKDALSTKMNRDKKNISASNINFSRNKKNIYGILKQNKNKKDRKSCDCNNNKNFLLFSYDYKKYSSQEKRKTVDKIYNQIYPKKNINNLNDTTKKIITKFNSKHFQKYNKKNIHSLSNTKCSSKTIGINDSCSKFINNKNSIYKFNNALYNSKIIFPKVDNNNNNYKLIKSESNYFISQRKKLCLNKIELRNMESIDFNNKSMKEYLKSIKNNFKYAPLETQDIEINPWKKGIYKEQHIKIKYDYNKLIQKVRKINMKGKRQNNIYRNIFDRNINMANISKRKDIYS